MKLEAVIVCVNYSDFLRVTLPQNKKHFDKIVVVTDKNDQETVQVCLENNVSYIQTDDFYRDGGEKPKPNKSIGINAGLSQLDLDGWVLQIDADIWLPSFTRRMLECIDLDGTCIYGIDRMMCGSKQQWDEFVKSNKLVHDRFLLHLDYFPIGNRIVQLNSDSYFPIGFFQLWNPNISGVKTYKEEPGTGFERTDILHVRQFAKNHWKFIPEIVCIHLASDGSFNGQNWNGRASKRFE